MKKSSQKRRGQQASAGPGKPAPSEKALKKRRTLPGIKTPADRYHLIFNAVNDAIFVHDMKTGRILDVNQKGCEMFRYTREEVLRLTVEDISASVRPSTMRSALGKIRRAAVSGKPQLFELLAKDKMGRFFWVEINLKRAAIGGSAKIIAVVRDITSRKRVEAERERQRNLFRTILDSTPDFLLLKDRNSVYRAVNPAFCRFIGKREDQIIGKTDMDLFPSAEAEQYREDDLEVIESGKPRTLVEFASGAAFKKWMLVTKTPVLGDGGVSVGILVSMRDITDCKLAEEELRKHRDQLDALVREQTAGLTVANENLLREIDERRQAEVRLRLFRSLIDHSNEAVFIADPETGLLLDINDQACNSLGYTRDEILAMRLMDFSADITDKHSWWGHSEDMKRQGAMIFESRHKRKDGSVFPVEINVRSVSLENKSYLISLTRDITERMRAERDLRVKESAIAASISGVAFGDCDGRLTYANNAFVKMWGYEKASEVLGKSAHEFCKEVAQAAEVIETLREQGRWFGYIVAKKKDGSFFDAQMSAALVFDNDGKPISTMASFVDVTDRKRAEVALRESEERLRQAVRVSHIGIFDHDYHTDTIYWSPQQREIYGWGPDETVTLPAFLDCVYPEDRERIAAAVRRAQDPAGDGLFDFEHWIIRHDGAIRWLTTRSQTFFDGEGGARHPVRTVGAVRDITERKQTEDSLRMSEEKYRNVVENSNDIIYRISLKDDPLMGKVEFVSGIAESIVGYRPEAFVEDPELWLRLVHPDDLPLLYETTRKILENRQRGIRVYRLRSKSSSDYLWMEDKIVPEIGQNGNVVGYFGVARDITKRKKDEEAILRSYDTQSAINALLQISLKEQGLDDILRQSLDLILSIPWLVLETKGCIFLSEDDTGSLVMKVQRGLEDFILKECSLLTSGKCLCGRAGLNKNIEYASTIDERHEIWYQGMTPHGHYCIPILFSGKTIGVLELYLPEGHLKDENELAFVRAFSNVLAGIIHREKMKEDREKIVSKLTDLFDIVSRSRKEWQETFDSITDLIFITDEDSNIIKVNKAFAAYYGLSPQEMIGRKCYEFFHGTDKSLQDCSHKIALNLGKVSSSECVDSKNKKTFLVSSYPYHSPEGELLGSISVAHDITDDREREMRLIMSERLASLGQMASGIAHEINNPLTAIAGCTEGLLNRIAQGRYDSELFNKYLSIIEEEVERCKGITTSMLSMVRKSIYEKKEFDIEKTLRKTLDIIGFQGRLKDITVVENFQQGMPHIHGSEGDLRQVLLAIITNALDAMDNKGTLSIDTRTEGDRVFIKISDTGPGIPDEHVTKIFDPFFTTKSERGGTGLGLSIARKIISNHNGTIDAVTTAEKGTTMTITLPKC